MMSNDGWLATVSAHIGPAPSRCVDAAALFVIHHSCSNQIENLTDVENYTHHKVPTMK